MKTIKFFIIFILMGTLLLEYSFATKKPKRKKEIFTRQMREFSSTVLRFVKSLDNPPKNVVFSPLSLYLTLGLLLNGAEGRTEKELLRAMMLTSSKNQINISRLMQKLKNNALLRKSKVVLNVADGLFISKHFTVKPSFLNVAIEDYDVKIERLNFNQNSLASNRINDWIANETNNKIKNLVQKSSLDADTRMVIANAVYFFATWKKDFKRSPPGEYTFTLLNGQNKEVTFIEQTRLVFAYRTPDVNFVAIPYSTANSMSEEHQSTDYFVIGKLASGGAFTSSFEKAMRIFESKPVEKWRYGRKKIVIPEFEVRYQLDSRSMLYSLGVRTLFDANHCNLSRISDEPLFASDFVHQAYIDVNQNGTEAAAVSVVFLAARSSGGPPLFVADGPFVYGIYNQMAGAYTFMGYVEEPGRARRNNV